MKVKVKTSFELSLSFLVVIILAGVYIAYELLATPSGGHPFGHLLGILGAVLMLATEVLYSARKRWHVLAFGQVRHWLSFHIFTGIVGPALVLMHTGFEFRGLAGLTALLTGLVVASGFIGRYIYTAVPRTMAGIEVDRRTLEAEAQRSRRELTIWAADKSLRVRELTMHQTQLALQRQDLPMAKIFYRRVLEWRQRRAIYRSIRSLEQEEKSRLAELEAMLRRQQRLAWQISSLQSVRRMMNWWHTIHVPLGLTLFTAMFIHILAIFYLGGL